MLRMVPASAGGTSASRPARASPECATTRSVAWRAAGRAHIMTSGCTSPVACRSAVAPAVLEGWAPAQTIKVSELVYEQDASGLPRIKYNPAGWHYWDWEGRKIHYIKAGPPGAPVVLLVHGYGASSYHWRYNVPALAEAGYQVYAIDLLGFGYSEKAKVDYSNGKVWSREVASFIREVVGPQQGPVVLAGNSLGGYVSLATAAQNPDLVRAVALLNGAGPFDEPGQSQYDQYSDKSWWGQLKLKAEKAVKRGVMYFAFVRTKQPERIREVLNMVYAKPTNVDEDLVTSIKNPADDPSASEVFFLVSDSNEAPLTVNRLLSQLRVPLLLLWGDLDPWITPARAQKIIDLYPAATKVGLVSGHCPQDDTPQEANAALLGWLEQLPPPSNAGSA